MSIQQITNIYYQVEQRCSREQVEPRRDNVEGNKLKKRLHNMLQLKDAVNNQVQTTTSTTHTIEFNNFEHLIINSKNE